MILKEALEKGYTYGRTAWERGYVSRKGDVMNTLVFYAGRGHKGQPYVLCPSWKSTRYCVRQYLIAPTNA